MQGRILVATAAFFVLNSCVVTHSGNQSSGPLLNAGDRLASTARGTACNSMVFPIGGDYSVALIQEAKVDMYRRFPLKEGEYYSNFTCDISRKIFLLYYSVRITIHADIMRTDSR